VSLPSSYRSRRGHVHLPPVLPLVGCQSKTPTATAATSSFTQCPCAFLGPSSPCATRAALFFWRMNLHASCMAKTHTHTQRQIYICIYRTTLKCTWVHFVQTVHRPNLLPHPPPPGYLAAHAIRLARVAPHPTPAPRVRQHSANPSGGAINFFTTRGSH
jgi:hypothetical protein